MYQKIRLAVLFILAVMTGAAYAAEITDVMVRQRWPWSRKVDIEYVLECEDGGEYDIEIKAYNGNEPLDLPTESLSGNLYGVKDGVWRIVWDPTLTDYTFQGALNNFRVELTLNPAPLYMVVDLTKAANDPEQIKYVYEEEIINGDWGTWERNPVSNDNIVIESVIWTGLTNDIYKTTKLVLRRIPATGSNGYLAGSPTTETGRNSDPREAQVQIVLTKPFYLGVYQVTQRQWAQVMGMDKWPSQFSNEEFRDMRPVGYIRFTEIRGSNFGTNWPGVDGKGDYSVDNGSFMKTLRDKTGNKYIFDLPTEAQWEWVCRAGTTGAFNDGTENYTLVNNRDANLDTLGRYRYNDGYADDGTTAPDSSAYATWTTNNGTAAVGSYKPNAWGLYDMHGNVYEWCLDWRCDDPEEWAREGGVDPVGAASGSVRVRRGGSWYDKASTCRSAFRSIYTPSQRHHSIGFRLVRHLP